MMSKSNKTKNSIIEDPKLEPYYIRIEPDQFSVHRRANEGSSYIPQAEGYYITLQDALRKVILLQTRDNLEDAVSLADYLETYNFFRRSLRSYLFERLDVDILCEDETLIPQYQTLGSSGCDLQASHDVKINPGEVGLIDTGINVDIPQGYEMQIRSRSGLSKKYRVFVINSPGTIDSDYRDRVGVLLYNAGDEPFIVNKNDRIAQGVFTPVVKAKFHVKDQLSDSERKGGFGHTGIK